jgi:hypothetical protein
MERLRSLGAVVAFPAAARPIGSGFEWDLEGDVGYLRALVGWLLARHPEAVAIHRRVRLTAVRAVEFCNFSTSEAGRGAALQGGSEPSRWLED